MPTVPHRGTAKAKAQDGKPQAESKAPGQKAASMKSRQNHQQNHTAKQNHGKCKCAHREARAKVARNGGPYETVASAIPLA
jgi:hypothetical protein